MASEGSAVVTQPDIRRMAVGCVYLFLERATLEFPGTTRAAPSESVWVNRTHAAPIVDGETRNFPFSVRWDLWENAVAKVLGDGALRTSIVRSLRSNVTGGLRVDPIVYAEVVGRVEMSLIQALRDTGYL